MKIIQNVFLWAVGVCFLSTVALADSVTYTTVADFQKADVKNGILTFTDDGEITQNTVLDPVSVTITSTSLPKGLFGHASCSFADTLVVAGGFDASNYSASVYLNTVVNNDLGSWTLGPDLPVGTRDHQLVKIGKYIYCFGGRTSTGVSDKVYKSEIDFSGNTLEPWRSAGNLPTALERFALVTYRSKVYVLGGLNGTATNKVYSAELDPAGNLMPWQEVSALPGAAYDLAAVVHGKKLITVGGNNGGSDITNIYMADINADGTLGSWMTMGMYTKPISRHTLCSTSVGLLVSGGSSSGVIQSETNSCQIGETYILSGWTALNLAVPSMQHTATVIGMQMFILGGKYNASPYTRVVRVPLSDCLGWRVTFSTYPDSVVRSAATSNVYDFAYVGGGADSTLAGTQNLNCVRFMSDGSTSTWNLSGILPYPAAGHAMTSYQNRIYVAGGNTHSACGNTTAVFFSDLISTNGLVTGWTRTTSLPLAMGYFYFKTITHNGNFYVFNGTSVLHTTINAGGSLGTMWTNDTSLTNTISPNTIPIVINNRMYVFYDTTGVSGLYVGEIAPNGSISHWRETLALPVRITNAGLVQRDGNLLINGYRSGGQFAYLGIINSSSGEVQQWQSKESLLPIITGGNTFISTWYENFCYIIGPGYPQSYLPTKYKMTIEFSPINWLELKNTQDILWTHSFLGFDIECRYRIFSEGQWGAWNTISGLSTAQPINQQLQYVQIGADISKSLRTGTFQSVSLNYSNLPPTPTTTPIVVDKWALGDNQLKAINSRIYPLRGESTEIRWQQKEDNKVFIKVYSMTGELMKTLVDGVEYPGKQLNKVYWNGVNNSGSCVGSGIYIVHIQAGTFKSYVKVAVIK